MANTIAPALNGGVDLDPTLPKEAPLPNQAPLASSIALARPVANQTPTTSLDLDPTLLHLYLIAQSLKERIAALRAKLLKYCEENHSTVHRGSGEEDWRVSTVHPDTIIADPRFTALATGVALLAEIEQHPLYAKAVEVCGPILKREGEAAAAAVREAAEASAAERQRSADLARAKAEAVAAALASASVLEAQKAFEEASIKKAKLVELQREEPSKFTPRYPVHTKPS